MEYRALTLKRSTLTASETEAKGWDFTGLAVPYDSPSDIGGGIIETITRDALAPAPGGVKLRLEHETTIGVVSALRSEADGLYIDAHISDTAAGRDARVLMNDGAITGLSVGFIPAARGTDISAGDDGITVVQNAGELYEVSLVSFPAYQSAGVSEIRSKEEKEHAMDRSAITAEDFEAVRASIDDLKREVRTLAAGPGEPAPPATLAFRTAGDYVKAFASGDETARRAFNDATSGVLADTSTRAPWVERTIRLMEAKQRLTNLFSHSYTLPSEGMSYEYPELGTNTVKVTEQENEGDELPLGKITLSKGSASVKTYGGYSEVSKQVVDRASANYLSLLYQAQAIAYAAQIESATADLFYATVTTQRDSSPVETASAAAELTADSLIDILLQLSDHYDQNSLYPLEGIICSSDVFAILAKIPEERKALQFTGAPTDKQGTITVSTMSGSLDSVPVTKVSGKAGVLAGYSSAALEILEAPGAPFRLQDDDITHLANQYSVYGYAAHAAPVPGAIVPVKFGG